jgi:hypothetical protein
MCGGRRAQTLVLGASSETTRAWLWPGFRACAPSVVDFGYRRRFWCGCGEPTLLLRWLVSRSFRLGPGEKPRQVVGMWPAHSLTAFAADSRGGSARCRSRSLNGCSRNWSVRPPVKVRVFRQQFVVLSMRRMNRGSFILLAIAACTRGPNGPIDPPYINGVVTARLAPVLGGQAGDSPRQAFPRARITDSTRSAERCEQSLVVTYSVQTPLSRRSGAPVDTGALQVGQRVSVWTEDLFLDSCPPQTGAVRLVVEDLR